MSRKHGIWLAVLSLLLIVPVAQAAPAGSWVISANGGMSLPTGDFGDENLLDAQSGFQLGGAVDYVINEMFALGVDGSWNQNKHGAEGETLDFGGGVTAVYDKDKFSTWQIGARGKYMFPTGTSPISPYLLVGAGMYNTTEKWEGTITSGGTSVADDGEESTDARIGFKGGLGAGFKATEQVSVGVEGDYNFITQDKDEVGVDSLQYMGVHAFVAWAIMPK